MKPKYRKAKRHAVSVPLSHIRMDEQDRRTMNPLPLDSLKRSMEVQGQLQNIELLDQPCTPLPIIAGHRRFLAAQQLGWTHIDAVIFDVSLEEALTIQWDENEYREGISVMEKAWGIQRRQILLGWSDAEAARKLNLAESTARDLISLNRCVAEVQELLHVGQLPSTFGLILSKMSAPAQNLALRYFSEVDKPSTEGFRRYCLLVQERADQLQLPGYDAFQEAYQEGLEAWLLATIQQAEAEVSMEFPALPNLPRVPRAGTPKARLALYISMLATSPNPADREYALMLGHAYNEIFVRRSRSNKSNRSMRNQ